jgi:hypothetical protein
MMICLVLLLEITGSLAAQTPQQLPPPKTPILARAPERAEWVITYRFDRDKAKDELFNPSPAKKPDPANQAKGTPALLPKETHVSKDGQTYREITTWSDGHKSEKWIVQGFELSDTPQGEVMRIMPFSTNYSDYSQSDFESAEWVAQTNYSGPNILNGLQVYGFEVAGNKRALTRREAAERARRGPVDKTEATRLFIADLDIHTQLPLYLDDGEFIRTYTYPGNTPEKLIPPPKFAQALESWLKEIKRKAPAPPPL